MLQLIPIGFTSSSHPFESLYVVGTPITVGAEKVHLTPGQEILLTCNIPEYPEAQFEWYRTRVHPYSERNHDEKQELLNDDERYSINNNVLTIKSSTIYDVGDYVCRVKDQLDGIDSRENMIPVRPKPFIMEYDLESSTLRSAVVEEGKMLKIPCNVKDDYSPPDKIELKWHMSKYEDSDMNEVNSGEDGIRLERHNTTSQDLIIDRVTKEHRRSYKCQVSNGITENSKSILIRVRDKYSFAWPAAGIIIQLVILMGVICFVENRKVEPDKGAYDRKAIQM